MFSPGAKFGKYTVVRLLGSGGMGAVYLVKHDVLDAHFALKVLSADMAVRNEQFIPRFLREAKLCCKMRHPNLVAVHDAGRDEATGLYYFVMDYAPGGTLRKKMDSIGGPMELPQVLRIARELASALVAASELGLVHRDIKPENIMFGADGEAKLADLGIAKASDDSTLVTMDNAVFGTPAYMSPEQAYDSGKVDARADIYSLGIVLFEMLAGKRPYAGTSSMNIITKVLSKDPVPDIRTIRPDVPEKFAAVVRDMCKKDAAKRIPSAKVLLDRLNELEGEVGSDTAMTIIGGTRIKQGIDPVIVMSVIGGLIASAFLGMTAWGFLNGGQTKNKSDVDKAKPLPVRDGGSAIVASGGPGFVPATNDGIATSGGPGFVAATNVVPVEITNVVPISVTNVVPVEVTNVVPISVTNIVPIAVTNVVPVEVTNLVPVTVTNIVPIVVTNESPPNVVGYRPLKTNTIIRPVQKEARYPVAETEPDYPSDTVVAGKAVIIGGAADDAASLKSRLGAAAFLAAENSSRLKAQVVDVCAGKPSCVYLKLGADAARAGRSADVFGTIVGEVANELHDKGVDFEFVLEEDAPKMRPYNDVIRRLCDQNSYKLRE